MGGRGDLYHNVGVRFPSNGSQVKHILRNDRGHLIDTPENRKLLLDTAKEYANWIGNDEFGNMWYAKSISKDRQVWVEVRKGIIQNGGINKPPIIDWGKRGIKK